MKKIKLFLITIFTFTLLVGCSTKASPVDTIERLYKAAIEENHQEVKTILSPMIGFGGYDESILFELQDMVAYSGGLDNLTFKLINPNDIEEEFRQYLDNSLENWYLVVEFSNETGFLVWTLIEKNGGYFVHDADDYDLEFILKEFSR